MAFGQPSGPPASRRQIDELAALLERAGFTSFREARHPYGLTQRQAAGRFSASEADELLERLSAAEAVRSVAEPAAASPDRPRAQAPAPARPRSRPTRLADLDDEKLVAELERRGWCCIPPLQEP